MESPGIRETPAFYDARRAGDYSYTPDRMAVFEEANRFRREFEVAPAAADSRRIDLLLIDVQRDFCHPEGTLYVGGRSGQGAVEDNQRIAEFIYRNLARITNIRCTLDSHNNFQIFFPWFWVDSQGEPLAPHTLITVDGRNAKRLVNIDPVGNVLKEDVVPNPAMTSWLTDKGYDWLLEQCRFYNRELAAGGRYTLYLWPPHCLVGSPGHTVTGVVDEARTLHLAGPGVAVLGRDQGDPRPDGELLRAAARGPDHVGRRRPGRKERPVLQDPGGGGRADRGRPSRQPLRQEHGAGSAGRDTA